MIGRVTVNGVERVLNWVPGLADKRTPKMGLTSAVLPPSLDLRSKMPPIRDQSNLGSCTAFSAEAPIYIAQMTAHRDPILNPSPLFIYYNERLLNDSVGSDAGAAIPDIYRAVHKYGVPDESLWPYDTSKYTVTPPDSVYQVAAAVRAHIYAPVPQELARLKSCLNLGFPIDFGISVYDSFLGQGPALTGVIPMPGPAETLQGGHAINLVGYNDSGAPIGDWPDKHFLMRNSWGTSWGKAGYGYLPFDYVLDPALASDMWMIRSI